MILAQVDPKTVNVAVDRIEKQPWLVPTLVLAAICGVMIFGLYLMVRKLLPFIEARQNAAQSHVEKMMDARGQEAAKDIAVITTHIGTKIDRIADDVSDMQTNLTKIATKIDFAAGRGG